MDILHKGEERQSCDELIGECDMHCADDLVMCLDHFNGHMGWHIDVFCGVH